MKCKLNQIELAEIDLILWVQFVHIIAFTHKSDFYQIIELQSFVYEEGCSMREKKQKLKKNFSIYI